MYTALAFWRSCLFFQRRQRVEFRDTDAAGIAHFSVFFNWMEQAEHAFLRHLEWSVVQDVEGVKISWPRVATQCVYHRPVVFESVFGVQVELTRIGRSSCTYRFRFLEPVHFARLTLPAAMALETGSSTASDWFAETDVQPFAEGTITAVCCRIVPGMSHQSVEIPAVLRHKLEPYLQPTFQE